MSTNIINWDQDADGVVTLTLDDPNQRANTMNDDFRSSLSDAIDRLEAEKDSITGVIVTSAKDTFFAGGDLKLLSQVTPENKDEFAAGVTKIKADFRRLEKLGKPTVAALNGAALGGGLEIALACNRRIALDNPKAQFGLPEVTLGLLPGAGGVTRITRLLGIADGLMKVLLQGNRYKPAQAVEVGIVDEIASTPDEMFAKAREWIKANPETVQPWDDKGYRMPGGAPTSPKLAGMLPAFPGNLRKQLKGAPMPAPHHIMCAAVEGAGVDIDTALTVEGRYFVNLATGQVAKNMIQAFWFDLNSINGGGSRPDGYEKRNAQKVAVLGAGMMGAGIAYVSARNGMEVVLKDVSIEAAEKGKGYSQKLLEKAVSRGKMEQAKADEVLARITPTADYADLAGCDLIVEAVFEKVSLKHEVFGEAEKVVGDDALLGSNTSTLPITSLAEGVGRKKDFIGLHFFSPVDKMPLLEIIRAEQTSDAALARALDYAAQIKKTPIVVNDSRGFFTSRVIGTFVNEAVAMLGEGVAPATIEQATTQAGYPVGALQLADELNLELFLKIRNETRDAMGDAYVRHPAEDIVEKMVELGRPGRLKGAGFFDYDESGKRTGLWPGLAEHFPVKGDPSQVDLHELEERMLIIEAIESARCVDEQVLITTADANIGSIMGIGFPPWTGGVLQYINGYEGSTGRGVAAFVQRAEQFTKAYGERFAPNELLRTKADKNETF
ncbi:3-hydroxyacyl-CoA dehydrogenase NAD-binding domain-containing protein [uncultured Jatrophihabitans sp.]|uniref:3-hydroxyacyl-CoA dehydrogenase NAD-binding domain-containing protein n=1 Tax=uncultured Jatrophihabitans sp. TaxID=1610747 RepID=UPI0035CC9249